MRCPELPLRIRSMKTLRFFADAPPAKQAVCGAMLVGFSVAAGGLVGLQITGEPIIAICLVLVVSFVVGWSNAASP